MEIGVRQEGREAAFRAVGGRTVPLMRIGAATSTYLAHFDCNRAGFDFLNSLERILDGLNCNAQARRASEAISSAPPARFPF